jgi:hypothetical protein
MTIAVSDLTQATLTGTGTFDVLMRAMKAHLDAEYAKDRLKGTDYSTVYLGAVTQVLQTALQFALTKDKAANDAELVAKQILLVTQQTANAVLEGEVLVAQKCKLQAEFDLTVASTLKVNQEIALLTQKVATERAQTTSLGVDADSVLGKQKALYAAQTAGFTRDAEQKAAKVMIDTWNVRRTTDEATSANTTNKLDDIAVGRAVDKLLTGIGA